MNLCLRLPTATKICQAKGPMNRNNSETIAAPSMAVLIPTYRPPYMKTQFYPLLLQPAYLISKENDCNLCATNALKIWKLRRVTAFWNFSISYGKARTSSEFISSERNNDIVVKLLRAWKNYKMTHVAAKFALLQPSSSPEIVEIGCSNSCLPARLHAFGRAATSQSLA